MSKIKDFDKFFEEATVKGNPAFPGEGEKQPDENQYLSDVERRAKQRLNIRPGDESIITPMGPVPSQKEMQLGRRIMQLLSKSLEYTNGKEKELSDLANVVFMSIYKDIVDRYEIELDIKIIKPGKVKKFMDDCEDCQMEPPPKFKEVVEKDIIDEVNKRKFANLIIQGEAKNTKHILHSEEVEEGLDAIYGTEAEDIFKIWDEMTKIADQLDWIIPAETKAQLLEQMPEGLAGACFIDWKDRESQPEEENAEEEEIGEWSEEGDEESMYSEEEIDDEPMERLGQTPIIRARGVDFPMLLHEAVKGLFEILALGGIPEDKRVAGIVLSNTGMSDEAEDFKYGPEVAADIRDFVNKSPRINEHSNIREELFKMLIDKETMPTNKFLSLMRGVLSNKEEARVQIDNLVSKIADMIKTEKEDMLRYNREMDEYEKSKKDWEENKNNKKTDNNIENDEVMDNQDDYSTMSQKDIMSEIDSALDSGDMDRVKMLSQYLKKESRDLIYRELELILENKNLHTK